tara:strand:+ start:3679 stop:4068 length:390 start_codon:yes stop_codon:yes gene_type:complete
MRIKYSFTTDITDLNKIIKFYLDLANANNYFQKSYEDLIKDVTTGSDVDYGELHRKLNEVRVNIAKYDQCIAEISDICTTIIDHAGPQEEEGPQQRRASAQMDLDNIANATALIRNLQNVQKKDLDNDK